jgi:hypothetical protein
MASKANDTKNWRKGSRVTSGDVISMRCSSDMYGPREMRTVATKVRELNNWRLTDETGEWFAVVSGHEYVNGQY